MTSAATSISSTCPYCGVGCGVRLTPQGDEGSVVVKGDPTHPANCGRLCSKGTHLAETVGFEGRLLYPSIGGQRAEWSDALNYVARNFLDIIRRHGPDSVAFYVSGQLLTEDYYVANKLMKGFIGSANIDTNSRLCMASTVAGHMRAFGEDVVPGCYEDLEIADLIILVGSNAAWCHPVLFQRIAAAREQRGTKVVVIDPRRTETCEIADLHLKVKPGSDVALFTGLLAHMARHDLLDNAFIARHVATPVDFWHKLELNSAFDSVIAQCDVPAEDLQRFYTWFAETPRTVTAFSQGVNQSSAGTDKVNAILNCHLATGRIGKPGASPFSLTGQPNAMGGREVGGLANQLAAHMRFENADIDRVMRFWDAPRIARRPGLKAVDLFENIGSGRVKAVWIMATNPAVSLPNLDKVLADLKNCPFIVVSDCVANTDTTRFANVVLPAAAWGEKDGTVTNSERRISRQRPFRAPPGAAKPDWWIINEVARRMGYARAFQFANAADIFREHAALSAFENNGERCFDIGAYSDISNDAYEVLEPFQWPARAGDVEGKARLFSTGPFFTSNARARLVNVVYRPPSSAANTDFPWALNTGRVRDHWHTMTRTGLSARLSAHIQEPFVHVHPLDAASIGLRHGDLVKLSTAFGSEIFRLWHSDGQRRGEVFCPIHWNQNFSNAGRVGRLIGAFTDPVSGQPEYKYTPVKMEAYKPRWTGFLITTAEPDLNELRYWARVPVRGATLYEIGGDTDQMEIAEHLLPAIAGAHRIDASDLARNSMRIAVVSGTRMHACLFLSGTHALPTREWLVQQFANDAGGNLPSAVEILAGQPMNSRSNPGPQVCACFNVGLNTLIDAIRNQKITTVADVGAALQAGTNCGSCKPKIQSLLNAERETVPAAAE